MKFLLLIGLGVWLLWRKYQHTLLLEELNSHVDEEIPELEIDYDDDTC